MTADDIRGALRPIFANVLDRDDIELEGTMSAADIEEWDSLNNVRLMVSIEKHFGIRFSGAEVETLKNVDDLVGAIATKRRA